MIYGPDGQPVLRSIEPGELEMASHLIAAELAAGPPIAIQIERGHAFSLVGALQLALRHPGMAGPSAEVTRSIAEQLASAVAGDSKVLQEALAMGWDPRCGEMGVAEAGFLPLNGTETPLECDQDVEYACPVCGCTDAHACPDDGTGRPCGWVILTVCTVCANRLERGEG